MLASCKEVQQQVLGSERERLSRQMEPGTPVFVLAAVGFQTQQLDASGFLLHQPIFFICALKGTQNTERRNQCFAVPYFETSS